MRRGVAEGTRGVAFYSVSVVAPGLVAGSDPNVWRKNSARLQPATARISFVFVFACVTALSVSHPARPVLPGEAVPHRA